MISVLGSNPSGGWDLAEEVTGVLPAEHGIDRRVPGRTAMSLAAGEGKSDSEEVGNTV